MNKKLLATAVASTLAAPMIAQAASHGDGPQVSVYGRINNALAVIDTGGDTESDIRNVSSRVGVRASSDLGNGLTVSGRYEFSTFTDREGNVAGEALDLDGDGQIDAIALFNGRGGINDTRIGTVGVAGSFGSVTVGNQWSAFYNTVGTHIDPTYTLGYFLYSSFVGGPYRASNTVKYAHSAGPVSWELDLRTASDGLGSDTEKIGADRDEDFLDGGGLGLNIAAGPVTVALAYDTERTDDSTDRTGIAVSIPFADHSVSVGYHETDGGGNDAENFSVYGHFNFGDNRVMVGLQSAEDNNTGQEPDQFIIGYYKTLGGGFRAYVEATALDADTGDGDDDADIVLLGMRYDF